MRATGIVRRIDDLGRVVVPKEIRKVLKIREGEALEIFTAKDNEIILKKYSPMGELGKLSQDFADTLSDYFNKGIIVTDRDSVVAVSKLPKKEYLYKDISNRLENIIINRKFNKFKGDEIISLIRNDYLEYNEQAILPIISTGGECIGSIIIISKESETISDNEEQILKLVANVLGKQVQ